MRKATCEGRILWDSVETANNFYARFKGLMGRKCLAKNEAMLITACNQVHTFNMHFTIDVIYLDKSMRVVRIDTIPPRKIGPYIKTAASVLEAAEGTASSLDIRLGNELTFI